MVLINLDTDFKITRTFVMATVIEWEATLSGEAIEDAVHAKILEGWFFSEAAVADVAESA